MNVAALSLVEGSLPCSGNAAGDVRSSPIQPYFEAHLYSCVRFTSCMPTEDGLTLRHGLLGYNVCHLLSGRLLLATNLQSLAEHAFAGRATTTPS